MTNMFFAYNAKGAVAKSDSPFFGVEEK